MTSVYAYFIETFDSIPVDESLTELKLDSVCGRDCKRVIDATKTYLESLPDINQVHRQNVLSAAAYQCEVFWRG